MLRNLFTFTTTRRPDLPDPWHGGWQLSDRSWNEITTRDAYYQRYCDTLHRHRIPFTITGERALQRYFGPWFAARDTEGFAKLQRVDTKLYIIVNHVGSVRSLLDAAGFATETEASWEALQQRKRRMAYNGWREYDWKRTIPPGEVIILDAREWNMVPMTVTNPHLEAHVPPASILFEQLLHQLLITDRFSERYRDRSHFAFLVPRWMSCMKHVTQEQILADLQAPFSEMLTQLRNEGCLYMSTHLSRADHRRYLAILTKGQLTDDDEAQLCRDAADEIDATYRRISRRDSSSLHDDLVSENEQIDNASLWLEHLMDGGPCSSRAPAWVSEEHKAWEIRLRDTQIIIESGELPECREAGSI